jgi:hypothetical protein
MERHADRLDWWEISRYQSLSESFMERHADRLDWSGISRYQSLSEPFMKRHADRLNWWEISHSQSLSEPFMERNADRLDWWEISRHQSLSEEFIERNADHLDWRRISRHQPLSEPFMERHADRLSKDLRQENWLYADRQEKLRHIRENAPEFEVQEDDKGPFIIAYKATRRGGRSDFKPSMRYEVGKTYEALCDHDLRRENSYGLSAWTLEGAKSHVPGGELYRAKIYVDDIGAMVHDGRKIRCKKQEFLERVK